MTDCDARPNRRSTLLLLAAASLAPISAGHALEGAPITVHKDPSCGCCSGWVTHLQNSGFVTKVIETPQVDVVKKRLGVPDELAACHTAEVAGYVIEGHVPASAVRRLLAEKPTARGLAVPGMPAGSPGMGGAPEPYDVVMFGPWGSKVYMHFIGARSI